MHDGPLCADRREDKIKNMLKQDVAELKAGVAANTAAISALDAKVSGIDANLSGIDAKFSGWPNAWRRRKI
jgi:hypothetical protein